MPIRQVALVEEKRVLRIKILGPNCYASDRVREATLAAFERLSADHANLQIAVQHVDSPQEIQRYPALCTPGLVVNGALVCTGRIPTAEEVTGWLKEALRMRV